MAMADFAEVTSTVRAKWGGRGGERERERERE
jgi:hypothetical protein